MILLYQVSISEKENKENKDDYDDGTYDEVYIRNPTEQQPPLQRLNKRNQDTEFQTITRIQNLYYDDGNSEDTELSQGI